MGYRILVDLLVVLGLVVRNRVIWNLGLVFIYGFVFIRRILDLLVFVDDRKWCFIVIDRVIVVVLNF